MILLNIFAFIFFLWIHDPYIELCNFDKYIDEKCNAYKTFDIIFPRSLAKHVHEKDLHNTNLRKNILNHVKDTKVKNLEENRPTYSKIKKNESSNIDIYMKEYKSRYEKKKGLYKLDCYCEKKLFDKFDYLHKIAEKRNNCRTSFMEKTLNRYGCRLFIFSLIPLVGLIFPALFCKEEGEGNPLISFCTHPSHSESGDYKDCKAEIVSETTLAYLNITNYLNRIIFSFIIPTIYFSMIIYGFIKVVKYERIKSGKEKMSFKEYCHFCKDLF
ncbi:Plasmodium exported protein, unknown function [Plasmodium vivax]|uniref:Variable surface protein Vir35 n=2 Tax=Plasmodium vivax TaxID=5855 RepID=A0A565A7F4_PLAVI|nr:Plasmodium exported protein, unknown function [Plasmodium vivax]